MAVGSSFKQKCPSCEALVLIKDAGLIGKKVECSKCKYRFVVEDPAEQDKAATGGKKKDKDDASGKTNGAKAPAKKRFRDDEEEAPANGKSGKNGANGKAKPGKGKYRDEDEDDAPAEKKKAGSNKMVLGLVLGGIGLVVLVVAGAVMMMMTGGSGKSGGGGSPPPMVANNVPPPPVAPPGGEEKKGDDAKKPEVQTVSAKALGVNPALTNLLPNDTEHVFHLFARDILAEDSALRDAAFQVPGSLVDGELHKRLGFSVLAVDDLIRAERFSAPAWSYTVVHLNEPVNEETLTEAMGLKKKDNIKSQSYFEATKPNPWFDQLARLAVGVPTSLRTLAASTTKGGPRPTYVRIHDPQTLIFADEAPLVALLRGGGKFNEITPRPVVTQPAPAAAPAAGPPGMMPPGMAPGGATFTPGYGPPMQGSSPPMPGSAPPGSAPYTPGVAPPMPGAAPIAPPGTAPMAPMPSNSADTGGFEVQRASFVSPLPPAAAGAAQGQNAAAMKVRAGDRLNETNWEGTETLRGYGKLRFEFRPGFRATMIDAKDRVDGTYNLDGEKVSIRFGGVLVYSGTISGNTMSGNARDGKNRPWTWTVSQQGGPETVVAQGPVPPGSQPMPPGSQPMPPGMPPGTSGPPQSFAPPGAPNYPGASGSQPTPPGMAPPGMMPPGMAGSTQPGQTPPAPVATISPRDEMYLTIHKDLKAMLDRMEVATGEDRVLLSSATNLGPARINVTNPAYKDRVVRQPRQFWDVTYLLDERKPNLRMLGTALVQREQRTFRLKNELVCDSEPDARSHYRTLKDEGAPQVARFFRKLLDHPVALPKEDAPAAPANMQPGMYPPGYPAPMGGSFVPPGYPSPMGGSAFPPGYPMPMGSSSGPPMGSSAGPPMGGSFVPPGYPTPMGGSFVPPGYPQPGMQPGVAAQKKDEPESSQMALTHKGTTVDFTLTLVLDPTAFGRLHGIAALLATALRSEMDLAAGRFVAHDLAKAGKLLGEKGLSDRELPPGQFPPGALVRAGSKIKSDLEPKNRLSWMTALLPYVGQQALYNKVNFDATWRDPSHWIAGRTLVPQFIDPRYPDAARSVTPDGLPLDFAATHFVGIAGVGLDAASYPPGDPAFVAKRGVLGYEKSATLEEVKKGRGLSNTVLLVQVPHDGVAGVTPWIAGGGATLRGVPEKNSIAPFVLTTDRDGRPIEHKGKRGTYALMTDGSVRFVDQNVSDDVFKAMVTVNGPAPENFDLNKNGSTPAVAEPKRKVEDPVEQPDQGDPAAAPKKKATPAAKKAEPARAKLGWVKFTPPEGGFSVSLPSKPQTVTQKAPTGEEVKVHLALQLDKGSAYVVLGVPVPPGDAAKFATDEGFREMAKGMAAQGGQITKETPITVGQFKGREYDLTITAPGAPGPMAGRARVILAGDRAIVLAVTGPGGVPADAAAFFDSLKIGN
jgi:hypothetical protein